jgi:quercetin dioxygenase-like cupin family protein
MRSQPPQQSQQSQQRVERLDLTARQADATEQRRAGVIGSLVGADLNVNVVRLEADEILAAHINTEVDVLLVGISGAGLVELDDGAEPLDAGSALYVPKGVRRTIRAGSQGVIYLTCHRRRGGLMPTPRSATPR